jgi:hypothetical protein
MSFCVAAARRCPRRGLRTMQAGARKDARSRAWISTQAFFESSSRTKRLGLVRGAKLEIEMLPQKSALPLHH